MRKYPTDSSVETGGRGLKKRGSWAVAGTQEWVTLVETGGEASEREEVDGSRNSLGSGSE